MSLPCSRRFETLEDRAVLNGGVGGLHAAAGLAAAANANVAANVAVPLCGDSAHANIAANVDLTAKVNAVVDAALATCNGSTTGDAGTSAQVAAAVGVNAAVGANLGLCNAVDAVFAKLGSVCVPSAGQVVNTVEATTDCLTDTVFSTLDHVANKVDNATGLLCGCS